MSRLVFVDVETTGTTPNIHEMWEAALVVRKAPGHDDRHVFLLEPTHLERADPAALRINRFYERTADVRHHLTRDPTAPAAGALPGVHWSEKNATAAAIARLTAGGTLVGLNVQFDEAFLGRFLRAHGYAAAWDYHLLELRSHALGYLRGRGGALNLDHDAKSDSLSAACGVGAPAPDVAHSALVDALWARDWYDAIATGKAAT